MNKTEPDPIDEEFAAEMREMRQQALAGDGSPMALARNRIILIGVILLLPAVFIGAYYFLVLPNQVASLNNTSNSSTNSTSTKNVANLVTVDQKLEALKQLERAANPQLSLPVQTQQFADRIEICEQLLAIEDNSLAKEQGILGKLAVLTQWQHLNALNEIEDGPKIGGLLEWAKTLLGHESEEVVQRAYTTVALAEVIAFARQPEQQPFSPVADRFAAAVEKSKNSRANALALFRGAQWLQTQEKNAEAAELYQLLESGLADASDREIQAVATVSSSSFHRLAFDFVGLSKLISANGPSEEIQNGFSQILEDPRIGSQGYLGLLAVVDLCMSKSRWQLAETLQERLQEVLPTLSSDKRDKISEPLQQQTVRLKARNQVFSFHDLQPMSGDNAPATDLNQRNRFGVIMYWDPGHKEAAQQVNVMMMSADGLSKLGADLFVICNKQLNPEEKTLLQSAATQGGEIKFIVTDDSELAGQKLNAQFPVTKYPFVVLLGRNNEVLMINPNGPDLRKELERLN